ncbi:MAG: hypothetical protein ALAOOOJD_03800 [bacterium]|nr:hypothetical protein [bacterium]
MLTSAVWRTSNVSQWRWSFEQQRSAGRRPADEMKMKMKTKTIWQGSRCRSIFITSCATITLIAGASLNALAEADDANKSGHPTRPTLVPAGMDTVVVARVGNIDITTEEFLLSYEFGPAFVKKRGNPKDRYLDFMINEKLLALDGYARGFVNDQEVVTMLKEVEGDLATEELYRDDILSQVSIDNQEIEQAIKKERVHLELKWLFAPHRDDLKTYLAQLAQGVPFDTLFNHQLTDSVQIGNRSLETTKFRLEDSNPAMACVVDTLSYGKISPPIEAPDGFYLVKVTNTWTNAIMTQTEHAELKQVVQRGLRQRRADALSERYVNNLMRNHNPVIVRQTFNILRALVGKTVLSPEKYQDWNLTGKLMSEAGPLDSLEIERYRSQTLVRLNGRNLLLGDFWTWYQARSAYIRFDTASPQRFYASLMQMAWRSVRDNLLVERAWQRGLQDRSGVQKQKSWWEEKLVYARVKEEMLKSIQITDEQAQQFYQQNIRQYRDPKGNVLPYEKVKDGVRQGCYAEELAKNLLRSLNILKNKYPVQINRAALETLPIDATPDPKAFDMITAKKGGTFPRPAVPTIDFDWKLWE